MEDDFKNEKNGNFNDTISNMKNELKNSQNLSKSINQLLQSEYALRNRLSEENETKKLNEEILKEKKINDKTFKNEKALKEENLDENIEILRPIYHDPFKKVLEKKEAEKQKKEILNKKEERQKLYQRYVKLLKMKKDIIESKGIGIFVFYLFY